MASELSVAVRLARPGFTLEAAHVFAPQGITALFGPSGSGKSTLLRIIAGLERSEGRVAFGEEIWAEGRRFVPAHQRGAGLVFQDARLFGHLSVAGNLAYGARRTRRRGPAHDEVVETLGISALLNRRIGGLSGGEARRVALARTLLGAPRLLLLDEPLAGLDLGRKGEILQLIGEIPRRFGLPAIFVSHDIDEVAQIAEAMVVLSAGRIAATGPAAEVLGRLEVQAATGRFEAGSLIEARITGHDPAMRLTRLDFAGQALVMPMVPVAEGATVRLRIRARDVALATGPVTGISMRNRISGHVSHVVAEPETAFAEVFVSVAEGVPEIRARLTRASVAELGLAPGRAVIVLIKAVTFDRRILATPPGGQAQG